MTDDQKADAVFNAWEVIRWALIWPSDQWNCQCDNGAIVVVAYDNAADRLFCPGCWQSFQAAHRHATYTYNDAAHANSRPD